PTAFASIAGFRAGAPMAQTRFRRRWDLRASPTVLKATRPRFEIVSAGWVGGGKISKFLRATNHAQLRPTDGELDWLTSFKSP
ncbi:MAG: hypothetical protein WAM44_01415, partial [Chthoniobacterales bacterium]